MTSATPTLGLGTVQWGKKYGIRNQSGVTSKSQVERILAHASCVGVKTLDTAASYGEAEAVIGDHELSDFNVVTKTPHFGGLPITTRHAHELEATFLNSLQNLRVDAVYGLLLHSAGDLLVPGGEKLLNALRAVKARGQVSHIGVSIYDKAELTGVLDLFTPDIVQLPVSVLDQRLILDGTTEMLRRSGIEIHARSIFLQGLLLMLPHELPEYFSPIRDNIKEWHSRCDQQGLTPVQGALSFVRDAANVDVCLIGVETLDQFEQCQSDFELAPKFDTDGLECDDPSFVNPARWALS